MASGVEVEVPESILTQTREEDENNTKIPQSQRITQVDTTHETEKVEQREKGLKLSKSNEENTDGECFLYPPTVEKVANYEDTENMSEEVKDEMPEKPSLDVESRETSNEELNQNNIPQIGIFKDDSIEPDGKEVTGILDRGVLSRDGNDSEEKENEVREPIKHDNEEASEVSQSTEIVPSECNAVEDSIIKDIDLEISEKYDEKSPEILEFTEMTASESDLKKSREKDKLGTSDEKEELIEDALTEVDSSEQTEIQTMDLPGSNPGIIESIHNVDEEQCIKEIIETRDIQIQKDSDVSLAEENTAESTTSPVDGRIDESEESEVISEENHIETDAKEMTGILDTDLPRNETDSSLGNDSAENEDESHDTKSEIELSEQDKQERVVLSEESIHNEAPQESSPGEEAKVKDINLVTGKAEEEKGARPLESESEKIRETDMKTKAPQNDLQKSEPNNDEKELTEDSPAEVDITQEPGVETVAHSLSLSNTEVNESIDNDDNKDFTKEKIESTDFPIENIEELKRCTSPETAKLEQSNKNLSLDETLDPFTHKSEASQLEENTAQLTSTSAKKIDESEESEVTSHGNLNLTPNATIKEDSKAHLTEESLTDSHPIIEESATNAEETLQPSAIKKLDSEAQKIGTRDIRDLEDQEERPTENLISEGNNEDQDQDILGQEPTEVENEEAQAVEQEAAAENIESRNFPTEKTEVFESSSTPETTTLEQSYEKLSLEETLDSSKEESDMSPIKENAAIQDTAFPVAEEIDDTPQNVKAEVNSSIRSIEIEGESDLPDKEGKDFIQDAIEVENTESQAVIQETIEEDFQHVVEKEIIDDEVKTNGVDEDSSQQHDDKNTAESDIGETLVTETAKDVKIVDHEFEERNLESSIGKQEDIEVSQDHNEKTNTSNDEVQLAGVQEETETEQLKDSEDVDSDNLTDAITTKENLEPVDVVEELDAKSAASGDGSLASEQEVKPNEHPLSEENSEGQGQSVAEHDNELYAEDPIYTSEEANQEATEVQNQEADNVKDEAKDEYFQHVFKKEIAEDEVKTNEADDKSSQQHNEDAIKSDIAETEEDGDEAKTETQGTDIVEKERMVDCGFQESNSDNSITNDDAPIEAPQSHEENTNVSKDEVQLLELKEEAETNKQLENIKDEDSNIITARAAVKENPELVDAVEKFETVRKLEAIDDNCDASDEAHKSVTEESSTVVEYEDDKSAEHLTNNRELSVACVEDEVNNKEVQLSADEDLQGVASDEEKRKAKSEQSETEESQEKDYAREEESVDQTFEENISSNEEINPKNVEVSPRQGEYTEISDDANQVIKIQEEATLKEQEENSEQEDPTSTIDSISAQEEVTVVENKETQTVKEEVQEEISSPVVEREIADDEMKANDVDERSSQPCNENVIELDIAETQKDGDEAHKIRGTDIVEKEKIVDRDFEESNYDKSIGNEEADIEASQIHEDNTNVSNDVDQLLEPQEGAKIEKQLEDVENEDSNSITDGISAKESPEPAEAFENLETVTKLEAIDDNYGAPDDADKPVAEESSAVEKYENDKFATSLSTNQDFTVSRLENELNDKEVQLSGETQSLREEALDRDLQGVASNEEKLNAANEQSETEESQLKDNTSEEKNVYPIFEEKSSGNEELNPEIIEGSPRQDGYTEIPDDTNQVIDVQEEAALREQEENLEQKYPRNIIDNVSAEENPKQAEDIEELEHVIQEEHVDNHGLSATEADNQLEDEESTQIPNTEVQKNSNAHAESGNEGIQGKETHEESGHGEIHGNETPTDEEISDQRIEETESGNVTSNQESTEVPSSQDECTVISDDGNKATDVQQEAASGKLQENIEDEDSNKMTDNRSTEQNPGPAKVVEKSECSATSDAPTESTITSDEAENSTTEEKIRVVESPDIKSPEDLLEEGHTEDEDCVNNDGDPNQSPEPVDAVEKFELESTTPCKDQEATEGQDIEETPNMKYEAIKEVIQRETVGKIGGDKNGELACESGDSNETRKIDLVQDEETTKEDSNSGNAINEETVAAFVSQDENADISNDEIQVIEGQEETKIEEPQENIENENSSNILEKNSGEENVKPVKDVRSEEGFQLVTNDEENIMDGNVEFPQQPHESNATELDDTELQREENVHEQSESNDIHKTEKVFSEAMESNEEPNQELIQASTLNIEDENPIASQDESNNSNEETQTEVQEEGTVETQLDSQQEESYIKSTDGASEDKELHKLEGGSESTELLEANKDGEEKTNMEVNDLEASSPGSVAESGNTEAMSLITKERDIDLAGCILVKEEDAAKTAQVCQINIQTQDINKRESKEEDLQQPILEERKDCEVAMDSKADNSQLEDERDISMSDEQCKSVDTDLSYLDTEKEIVNEGLQAAAASNEVQKERPTTADEASEQNADVEKDTLSRDASLGISNDLSEVVEVNETEVRDRECQPRESENLENIDNISSAQVEEVKDDLKVEQDIPKETIEEEKQGTDPGKVKSSITNMSNVEEETGLSKDHPEGNIVNTLDVFSHKKNQESDKDDVEDTLPEIEQLENPVGGKMAESSQTNEQELEMKSGHTSTTEDKEKITVLQLPNEEVTEEKSLEKETQDARDEPVSNSEFEPTKDSELKEDLVQEAAKINESSISSNQEQSESSEQALKLDDQELTPIQAEETDEEMVKNEVSSELRSEENQCEKIVEAQDATVCHTKVEEVKYMDEPRSTHKTETTNTEVTDSLYEGINESNAAEMPQEHASVKESEKAENVLTREANVPQENLEGEEKHMVACYENMPSTENITLVKDETISQQSHQQENIKEAIDVSSTVETEQVDDRKHFSPEGEEVISTPQLEHESRDVALVENNMNQPTEKLHVVHTEREVMLPDCQDVEEVSAADIIACQIARAIEEEEQWQQQSSEQEIEKHEVAELVPDMDDNTLDLENQVPKEENKKFNSLEEKTKEICFPEERGIAIEVQKDMYSKKEMVEKVEDSQISGTEDLPSASPGTGSPSEDETNKLSVSSMDGSSQELLNEKEIKDSNKSREGSSSPQVDTINDLIPEENSAKDDNEGTTSLEKEPEITSEERNISEELDQDEHQKIIGSEFMEDGKTILTSDVHQATSCDAATEQVAERKVVQETSPDFQYEETRAQIKHKDPLASARSVEDDEKPAIIAKNVEVFDEKVQDSQKITESSDKVEMVITEVEEERRTEFSDTLGSGKKEAVAHGKVSPLIDIPKTQATILVPGTPEATEERETIILTDDFDSPTEQKKSHNAITGKESILLENQQVQAPRGLEEDIVRVEDGENEETEQTENMDELENTKLVETHTRSMPMDSSVLTSQADGDMREKVEQASPKDEKTDDKEIVIEEMKTDKEKNESVDQSQEDLEQSEMPITAEALGEMEFKATHKKSHNILLGVGSKVKHSISMMKKAIACSSGQFSQEEAIIKVNKNKKG